MDDALLDAERGWLARPDDPDAVAHALTAFERADAAPPWGLIAAAVHWRPYVDFVRAWFARPLEASDGCRPEEVAATENRLGRRLPSRLREWFLLCGRRAELPPGISY